MVGEAPGVALASGDDVVAEAKVGNPLSLIQCSDSRLPTTRARFMIQKWAATIDRVKKPGEKPGCRMPRGAAPFDGT